MKTDQIQADYIIETDYPLEKAVDALAGEQSCGTFIDIPGETKELKAKHKATVEKIEIIGEADSPSLPIPRKNSKKFQRAKVSISWPLENMGPSLPNVLATLAGNLFELSQFSALKLIDVRLPPIFGKVYPGPQFGIEGTRKMAEVYDRPFIGTIIKPSVGFNPDETAQTVKNLAEAGLDFIKDDELQADGPHCPFEERVEAVMKVIRDHSQKTGKKVMFAFNITGEIDEMKRRHDFVKSRGGTCIMVSIHSIGLPSMKVIREHSCLPIHAHRNGWGIYSRSPHIGIGYCAWQVFWRLAGADHMHVNGLDNKFCEENSSVIASAKKCLTPLFPDKPYMAMPVFSSGQSAKQPEETYRHMKSPDLMYVAGGGIMGHPKGFAAGVLSLKQAWEAAMKGIPRDTYAEDHPELKQALNAF